MKTLYTNSFRILLVVFTFSLLVSCSKKEDPDPRDQYVGSWVESMLNGQADTGDKVTISKSGSALALNDFLPSGSFTATLSGSGFQADSKKIAAGATHTFSDNSKGPIYIQNLTGSLSGDKLTLTFTYYSESSTKYTTADFTEVFTKK